MDTTFLEQMAAGESPPLLTFNVEQYHQMIRGGILPEGAPIELIDGLLVWKDRSTRGGNPMSQDPRHGVTITLLQDLNPGLQPFGFHMRIQLPVTLSEKNEPEPDVAVVRGSPRDYSHRHPGPADIAAAIEVSDSSLQFDRTTKYRKYADASIPQYWIVNLVDNQVEVYEEPLSAEGRYARRTDYRSGKTVRLALLGKAALEVRVDEILPA